MDILEIILEVSFCAIPMGIGIGAFWWLQRKTRTNNPLCLIKRYSLGFIAITFLCFGLTNLMISVDTELHISKNLFSILFYILVINIIILTMNNLYKINIYSKVITWILNIKHKKSSFITIVASGIAIWTIANFASSIVGTTSSDASPYNLSTEIGQDLLQVNAEEAVRQRLKDPDTAKFRNVRYHNSATVGHAVCGEVNSKNSFGAYSGYTRFVSNGTPNVTFLESESSDFKAVWKEICK